MKVAIDSDIFFFCIVSGSNRSDIDPEDMRRFLNRLSGAPKIKLYVPISVIGEVVIICLTGSESNKSSSTHDLGDLHDMIDLWGKLDLAFLYPNEIVAEVCYRLTEKYRADRRLTDTDRVHLCYALAYRMDYFLTTDQNLKHYVPANSGLKVIDPREARSLVAKPKD